MESSFINKAIIITLVIVFVAFSIYGFDIQKQFSLTLMDDDDDHMMNTHNNNDDDQRKNSSSSVSKNSRPIKSNNLLADPHQKSKNSNNRNNRNSRSSNLHPLFLRRNKLLLRSSMNKSNSNSNNNVNDGIQPIKRDYSKRLAVDGGSEIGLMIKSLRRTSEPMKCRESKSLEHSPYLLKKYGPVDEGDNWCEMSQSLTAFWEREFAPFQKQSTTTKNQQNGDHEQAHHQNQNVVTRVFNNGTTYFDYPSSSDGQNWPYYRCPVKHRITCGSTKQAAGGGSGSSSSSSENNNSNKRKTRKRRKTKALVIFIVSSGSNTYQVHQESANMDYFIKNGYIPANTPTALFDAVDFVFAKIQLTGQRTDNRFMDCGKLSEAIYGDAHDDDTNSSSSSSIPFSNVQFLMVPQVSCDLCAHSKILEYITNKTLSIKKEQYRFSDNRIRNLHLYGDRRENMTRYFMQMFDHDEYWRKEDSGLNNNNDDENENAEKKRQKTKTKKTKKQLREEEEKETYYAPYDEEEDHEYSQIFMLNSGVRGPFFTSADDDESDNNNNDIAEGSGSSGGSQTQQQQQQEPKTTWVDFVAMSGRRRIPNPRYGFLNDQPTKSESRDCPIHVSVSSSISFELGVHHQSFFLSMPYTLLRNRIFPAFANVCPTEKQEMNRPLQYRNQEKSAEHCWRKFGRLASRMCANFEAEEQAISAQTAKDKRNCIGFGEVSTGRVLLEIFGKNKSKANTPPAAMYSLSKQFYVHNYDEDNKQKGNFYYHPRTNPSYNWNDPCKSVFVKDGGEAFIKKRIPPEMVGAIDRLSRGANMFLLREQEWKCPSSAPSSSSAAAMKKNTDETPFYYCRSEYRNRHAWDLDSVSKMFEEKGCLWKL